MAPTALTIAGSDSGGGAGIQADLKAFSAMGVYGASVITAITAQNTCDVTAVHPVPDAIVAAQIDAVLGDIRVDAIKIGMLGAPSLIETVARAIEGFEGAVVLDPVMISKSGVALLPDDAVDALKSVLVPRATLLTPNLPEAARLLDASEGTDPVAQGKALRGLGAGAALMKGGHAAGQSCTDWLVEAGRETPFTAPRLATRNTHGTGCSMSSAIAARLAKGEPLDAAVGRAHGWLHGAIATADQLDIGKGHGPVHHFHEMWG
ncbi:hydroxymethylpyrimidine kinase [Actibacterium mucosum KCTC 23349]|uniref:hydroxymethylpyrimidine kinase n=1 Tax=Actibacterium mucosum KCTC 23349 TaxID=1454373 RepID=A0A037ZFE6_9RHOB|nr:bifunctional hydroxymethylpyrimidine kinase/phosphomethylpyrimidine kinase [Actibacterium mucosum]KAJ54261.1 hydroxymethylpyrimidine kinase [Actibacterium mucosum KCTC 23349]